MPEPFIARPFFRPPEEELRYLPESPRVLQNYPGGRAVLGWVAIQHGSDSRVGSVNLLDLATRENERHDLPGRPGFFVETDQPGLIVVGLERRLVLYDLLKRNVLDPGIEVTSDERVLINEGLAVSGGIIFGTKDLNFKEQIASAYFFDTSLRRLSTICRGEICSNGKYLFERGGRTVLAEIDSPCKTVDIYDADLPVGRLGERAVLTDFRQQPAFPDGMRPLPGGRSAVVAFYNPTAAEYGIARQISLDTGDVEAEWHLPGSPRVTCPEFAQVDGRVLLLFTTAVESMPEDQRRGAPNAGSIFIAATDFDVLPPPLPLLPALAFEHARQ